jgi:ribosomal protein S18 acetylase RimI-like enzyme
MTAASWVQSTRDCELWAGWRVRFPIDIATLPASLSFTEHGGYVWSVDDRVVGFGQIVLKPAGRKHLGRIIVDPTVRRRGYGEAFVRALLAKAAPCSVISLNVDKQNMPAISLYQRLGFVDA